MAHALCMSTGDRPAAAAAASTQWYCCNLCFFCFPSPPTWHGVAQGLGGHAGVDGVLGRGSCGSDLKASTGCRDALDMASTSHLGDGAAAWAGRGWRTRADRVSGMWV
jgi:hypothetical protein